MAVDTMKKLQIELEKYIITLDRKYYAYDLS